MVTKEQLDEYIDCDSDDKQEIYVKILRVPLNLAMGSRDSREFLDKVPELKDEAYYTPFRITVDYKW